MADADAAEQRPPRRRRRWRHTVASLLALAVLAAIGGVGYDWARHPKATATALPICPSPTPTHRPTLPVAKQVHLMVLNGTSTTGLAHRTAVALGHRGFQVDAIGNASPLTGPAQVRYGSGAAAAAAVVGFELAHVKLRSVPSVGAGQVELVLGTGFTGLRPPAAAAAARAAALRAAARSAARRPSPRPASSGTPSATPSPTCRP